MKAIVYHHYGSPEVLKCEEIEKPAPGDSEVLIKVCAAHLVFNASIASMTVSPFNPTHFTLPLAWPEFLASHAQRLTR